MLIEFKTNNEDLKNERLLNITIFRVISMLMIVLFHCMCFNAGNWNIYECTMPDDMTSNVSKMLDSLALPFFFLISGFLYSFIYQQKNGYRNWGKFITGKTKRLILPTISWTIIYLILLPFRYTVLELISGIRHLWFLPTLFVIFIIARLISPFLFAKRKFALDMIMALLFIVVTNLISRTDGFELLKNVAWYVAFFVGGMMYYKHRFTVNNKLIASIAVILLVGCHGFMILTPPFHGQSLLDTLALIAIGCLLIDLFSNVKMDKNSMPSRILSNLDKNSLGIYLVHQVFIMTLYQYTLFEESWLTFHPYIGPILLFVIVLPLSWAFAEAKRRLKLEPFL